MDYHQRRTALEALVSQLGGRVVNRRVGEPHGGSQSTPSLRNSTDPNLSYEENMQNYINSHPLVPLPRLRRTHTSRRNLFQDDFQFLNDLDGEEGVFQIEGESEGEEEEDEEGVILHSPTRPMASVCHLVRRIEKVTPMMKDSLEEVKKVAREEAERALAKHKERYPTEDDRGRRSNSSDRDGASSTSALASPVISSTFSFPTEENEKANGFSVAYNSLRRRRDLLFFLWSRLLRLLTDENERTRDLHATSLSPDLPSVLAATARYIYRQSEFSEIVRELSEAQLYDRPYPEEISSVFPSFPSVAFYYSSSAPQKISSSIISSSEGEPHNTHTALPEHHASGRYLGNVERDSSRSPPPSAEVHAIRTGEDHTTTEREENTFPSPHTPSFLPAQAPDCLQLLYQHHVSRFRVFLRDHYSWMLKMQRVCVFCGLVLIERSSEGLIDPMDIDKVCQRLSSEKSRQKRLLPLSLLYFLLQQEDPSTEEIMAVAMTQGVPRDVLQWLQHLSPRLFRVLPEDSTDGIEGKGHPANGKQEKEGGQSSAPLPRQVSGHSLQPSLFTREGANFPLCSSFGIPNAHSSVNASPRDAQWNASAALSQFVSPSASTLPSPPLSPAFPSAPHEEEYLVTNDSSTRINSDHHLNHRSNDTGCCIISVQSSSSSHEGVISCFLPPSAVHSSNETTGIETERADPVAVVESSSFALRLPSIVSAMPFSSSLEESSLPDSPRSFIASPPGNSTTLFHSWSLKRTERYAVHLGSWEPQVGHLVGRGPCWHYPSQGEGADYGVVVGVVPENGEVLVIWIPSEDFPAVMKWEKKSKKSTSRKKQDKEEDSGLLSRLSSTLQRLYRYRYTEPLFEVVHWDDYLRIKVLTVDYEMVLFMEFTYACSVAGILCKEADTITQALQFDAVPCMLQVLNSTNLASTHHHFEVEMEAAEARAQQRLDQMRLLLGSQHSGLRAKSDEKWLQTIQEWDSALIAARDRFRRERACVDRAGCTLNALLGHKKLAHLFLEYGGVKSLLRLMDEGLPDGCTTNGCTVLLSRLSRGSIFEEFLRQHHDAFQPVVTFILALWMASPYEEAQVNAGLFLFHSLSFPCVLRHFDCIQGGIITASLLNRILTASEEQKYLLSPSFQLTALRCFDVYLISHLILATCAIFCHHRSISTLVRHISPSASLPRDPVQLEIILGHLSSPTPTLPGVTRNNVRNCLTLTSLTHIQQLLQHSNIMGIFLRGIQFYGAQGKWDHLTATLQALRLLTVIPETHRMLLTSANEMASLPCGVGQVLTTVRDLSHTLRDQLRHKSYLPITSKVTHIIHCLSLALHIFLNILAPPPSLLDGLREPGCSGGCDGTENTSGSGVRGTGNVPPTMSSVRGGGERGGRAAAPVEETPTDTIEFNSACAVFRASDGVGILLEFLQSQKNPSEWGYQYFSVVACAVEVMVMLSRYADTCQLFEALGVHDVAYQLGQLTEDQQRRFCVEKPNSEHHPATRYMSNIKILKRRYSMLGVGMLSSINFSTGITNTGELSAGTSPIPHVHPFSPLSAGIHSSGYGILQGGMTDAELDRRQAIAARAVVDYKKDSLLELMARHLEKEGLTDSARTLRRESGLSTTESVSPSSPGLDGLVRAYLRHQQSRCSRPIETLPMVDLTSTRHVYEPPPPPPDTSRGVQNRILQRKLGRPFSKQMCVYDACFTYSNMTFLYDLRGMEDLLCGESICFLDHGNSLAIGSAEGALSVIDVNDDVERILEEHALRENEFISALFPSSDGSFLSVVWNDGLAEIRSRSSLSIPRMKWEHCKAVRLSPGNDLGVCTMESEHCHIYDISAQECILDLHPGMASNSPNEYGVGIMHPTAPLVLYNAQLWDIRASSTVPVVQFDRFSESYASMFHPWAPHVLMDERVWDLRKTGILHTIPAFQRTASFHISDVGRAIYSFQKATEGGTGGVVSAVESLRYELIFGGELNVDMEGFVVDPSDRYCAAVMNRDGNTHIRFFGTSSGCEENPFVHSSGRYSAEEGETDVEEDSSELDYSLDDEDDEEILDDGDSDSETENSEEDGDEFVLMDLNEDANSHSMMNQLASRRFREGRLGRLGERDVSSISEGESSGQSEGGVEDEMEEESEFLEEEETSDEETEEEERNTTGGTEEEENRGRRESHHRRFQGALHGGDSHEGEVDSRNGFCLLPSDEERTMEEVQGQHDSRRHRGALHTSSERRHRDRPLSSLPHSRRRQHPHDTPPQARRKRPRSRDEFMLSGTDTE